MTKTTRFTGIDLVKLFFAFAIPFLHIGFERTAAIVMIRECVSRLGVPFFFAASGMLLADRCNGGRTEALKKYIIRIGRLLLLWLIIYLPIMVIYHYEGNIISFVQLLLFKTPGYLWYLSALLFAAVPFCLIKNRTILLCVSMILYMVGTAGGGNYSEFFGEFTLYNSIFLTTRNGLFFALPLMCIGEHANVHAGKGNKYFLLSISLLLYWTEVFSVNYLLGVPAEHDHSMYFLIPFVIYCLIRVVRDWNPELPNYSLISNCSTAIYVVQYGCIALIGKIYEVIGIPNPIRCWVLLFTIITLGCFLGYVSSRIRILKHLV